MSAFEMSTDTLLGGIRRPAGLFISRAIASWCPDDITRIKQSFPCTIANTKSLFVIMIHQIQLENGISVFIQFNLVKFFDLKYKKCRNHFCEFQCLFRRKWRLRKTRNGHLRIQYLMKLVNMAGTTLQLCRLWLKMLGLYLDTLILG